MNKVILIVPPSLSVEDDRVEPPLGLLYIAAQLRDADIRDVVIYDMTGKKDEREIESAIESIPEAEVYGISCLSTNYHYALRLISTIRGKSTNAKIVLGGPHPTALPELSLAESQANFVIAGEGEDLFVEVMRSHFSKTLSKKIHRGLGRDDIDSYAFPARDLVDHSTYSRRLLDQPVVSLISSRGCRHRCRHCNSVVMGGGNEKVRYRSPNNICQEIEQLRDIFRCFRFNDDHFTGNPEIEELLNRLKEFDIVFRIFARAEDLDETICNLLHEAGCVHVTVGLESLNPPNLRFLGRGSQIGKEGNILIAKDNGLKIRASFIVGLPYDSDESILSSFERAAGLGIDEFAIYPLIPYPGTSIYQNFEKFGYRMIDENYSHYIQMGRNRAICIALEHEKFSCGDIQRWLKLGDSILQEANAIHMSESAVAR